MKTMGIVVVAALAAKAEAVLPVAAITATSPANQIGRQCRQPIDLILRPAVYDRQVLALDIAGLLQALAKCAQTVRDRVRRCGVEEPDHRHRRLLRARRERPRSRRAAEKRDELAPLHHSITSSARSRNGSGMFRPSALAVVRLMTSSNLVGCSTGMSAGFVPCKILSTRSPARRNRSGMFGP